MSKKKRPRKITTSNSSYNNEVVKTVIILFSVLAVLGITYVIAGLMTGEIKFGSPKEKEETPAEIQYEEIIMGEIFNQPGDEYYVLLFDFTNNYASSYITYKDVFEGNTENPKVYLVDMEKGFNKGFLADEGEEYEQNPDNFEQLKVKSPSLLKISNHKVTERYEGKEAIEAFFSEDSE